MSEMLWHHWKLSPFRKKLMSRVVTRLQSEPGLQMLKPLGQTWRQDQVLRSWVDPVHCEPALTSPNIARAACPHCFRNTRVQPKFAFGAGLSRLV